MTYVVESGDTIETIARKYNVSPNSLMQMNNLSSSNQLKVGMIITITPSSDMACCNAPLGAEWCPRLSLGSRGPAVEELQSRLRYYGYYTGRQNGVFDWETETALRNFQRTNGLWGSGTTDRETWRVLGVTCRNHTQSTRSCPTLRRGSRGSAVSFLQSLLQRRGYYVTVDGNFGRRTEDAVMALQRDNGFFANGEVDQRIWDLLGVTCLPLDNSNSGSTWPPNLNVPASPGGYQPPMQVTPEGTTSGEPNLDGLNYNWQEIGDFRYVLTTNRYRYREGEPIEITFRKRNLTNEPVALRYPSDQLFDFYISDAQGIELWRWSKGQHAANVAREIVLAPDAAETINIVWDQRTDNGYWIPAQTLTLWGTNTATNVSIPLNIEIY